MNTSTIGSGGTKALETLLYRVKPGDTLTKILKQYHSTNDEKQILALIDQVQADNPSLTNPDLIKPDQLIRLSIPQQYCPAPNLWQYLYTVRSQEGQWINTFESNWNKSTKEERTLMAYLLPAFIGAGSAKLSALETTFTSNQPLLTAMVENYENYKSKNKTKGQYDYQRRKLVEKLTGNLGPTNVIVNGNQAPSEVLRISRTKGTLPTASIERQLRKLKTTASLAKGGGLVLTGVSLGIACNDIAKATTVREKNEIFVEASGGVVGGVVYGIAAGLAVGLMATPVGWVGALIIGAGSLVAGAGGGAVAKKLYDINGNKVDFVGITGVDRACSVPKPESRRRVNSIYSNNAIYSQ